jgi:Ricin-type beta-trefoil lectin domain
VAAPGDQVWESFANGATGRCLDDSTAFNNVDVLRGYQCLYNDHQTWYESGYATEQVWRNRATGRCLDDSTAFNNDVLRGYKCNGKNYQQWH